MLKSKDLLGSILLLTILIIYIAYIKPFLIIDETRYIGVAWEMYNSGNYFVPTLNGVPYDHKPPLLFWLINLDWHLFGLNSFSLRFIPLLFAIGSIILSLKIYKIFWSEDSFGQRALPWVLVGTTLISFYTTLFMFDIMLSFWVLLAIYAGIMAVKSDNLKYYLLLAFSIGFGILAKSPVVAAHLLPLYLFASYWSEKRVKFSFYVKGALSLIGGILIALIWAIPAAKMGGDAFAKGIFWEQYAGRAVNSFAHKRPFWWYLPWIAVILMPWIFNLKLFSGFKRLKNSFDEGLRFLLVWIVGAFLIFSLISGKQLHYIVPEFFAFAMLITRAFSLVKESLKRAKIYGFVLMALGIIFLLAPLFIKGNIAIFLDKRAFFISGAILIAFGLIFILKSFNPLSLIRLMAISSVSFIALFYFTAHLFLKAQDLSLFSKEIAKLQNKGVKIVHIGKYANQYQYFGRLKKPLIVLWGKKEIKEFIKNNPNSAIIFYKKAKENFDKNKTIAITKFRTQNAILIWAKDWEGFNHKSP